MFQRGFFLLQRDLDLDTLFRSTEPQFIATLLEASVGTPADELWQGLFGPRRRLYKRWAEFSYFQERELYEQIARRPYPWLEGLSSALADGLSAKLGRRVAAHQVLVDAPPVKREVEFHVEVAFPKEQCHRNLGDISPAVHALATRQFDDYVKRVRIFIAPELLADALAAGPVTDLVSAALPRMPAA
jgi:hypothetical protein